MYKPAGIPARTLEWVYLAMDEFETIRLLDHEGLAQEKAAELMGISRPTVTRIYASARKKIAEALTEGKAISIEGGPVESSQITPPQQGGQWGVRADAAIAAAEANNKLLNERQMR